MRTKENIRSYAELGYLEYVDGYYAQITSMKPSKNQDDKECWELILMPTDKLISRYGLVANKDGTMLYTQEIVYEHLIQLNADPSNTRWLCLITYEGNETHVSSILKGASQQKEITLWKEKFNLQKERADVAIQKLKEVESNMPKYIKENLTPIMEQFYPMLKDLAKSTHN